jgi:hypothetical protein
VAAGGHHESLFTIAETWTAVRAALNDAPKRHRLDLSRIGPFQFLSFTVMGLLVVFGLYAIGLLWATHPVSELSISKAASFGDSFGVITSLFAGLGFAGLLATIFLQREELKLTRRELQETKQTLTRQRFEESV